MLTHIPTIEEKEDDGNSAHSKYKIRLQP